MSLREVREVRRVVEAALEGRERVLLAVSGGLDSMVLLHAAAASVPSDRIVVATFDHGTGAAASEAVRVVERVCVTLGLSFASERAEPGHVLSTEAALRDARWRFLRKVSEKRCATIVTAHTEDDQIETVLMRVMRGAGARGLAGLYATSDVLRPFVTTRRSSLATYARAAQITWVEDPSNQSRRFLRNRLRHDLLPALRRVSPSIDAELLASARAAADWRREVEDLVANDLELGLVRRGAGLDVRAVALARRAESELSILWPAIVASASARLDRRAIARVTEFTRCGRVGASVQLAGGWEVTRSRDAFQLRALSHEALPYRALSAQDEVEWGEWSFRPAGAWVRGDQMSACLPAGEQLYVRAWRSGDTIVAAPGAPARKVKQLLSRAGITGHDRVGWPVVVSGGRVVWIPGVRRIDPPDAPNSPPGLLLTCEYRRR